MIKTIKKLFKKKEKPKYILEPIEQLLNKKSKS